jgi:hypothetical protein
LGGTKYRSIAHLCIDRTRDSTRIEVCSGRQHCVAVPLVDTTSSSQCRTRHLHTGGVPRNGYVLVLNPNPMPTCASLGSVNPTHIMVARQTPFLAHIPVGHRGTYPETPTSFNLNLAHGTDINCSNPCSFLFQPSIDTSSTCPYCWGKEFPIPCAHFFCKTVLTQLTLHPQLLQHSPWPTQRPPVRLQPRPNLPPPIV